METEPTAKPKHELAVLDWTGDTKVMWSKDNDDEVENAESTYNKLKKKGYIAFSVKKDGSPGEKLHRFDSEIERMIMMPQPVGG